MSIIDYLLWAVQRYIIKKEERFLKALIDKYEQIIDLYDFDKIKKKRNYYVKQYPFDLNKASDFEI